MLRPTTLHTLPDDIHALFCCYHLCISLQTPVEGYCCGGAPCPIPVPEPPTDLPPEASMGSNQRRRLMSAVRSQPRRKTPIPTSSVAANMTAVPRMSHSRRSRGTTRFPTSFPPNPAAEAVCEANPRVAVSGNPPFAGMKGASVLIIVYFADPTEGTSCEFTPDNLGYAQCTGQQIGPYLVLTSQACLDTAQIRYLPGCENSELVDAGGECKSESLLSASVCASALCQGTALSTQCVLCGRYVTSGLTETPTLCCCMCAAARLLDTHCTLVLYRAPHTHPHCCLAQPATTTAQSRPTGT